MRFQVIGSIVVAIALAGAVSTTAGAQTEKVLYRFKGRPFGDGAQPYGQLLPENGNAVLYGTTFAGGSGACKGHVFAEGCGTVFELMNSGGVWTESVLHSFAGTNGDGAGPFGRLAQDSQGNLYGITQSGGAAYGTVFEMTQSGGSWSEQVLYSFTGQKDGSYPADMTIDQSTGSLYGLTGGGASGCGTVFELVQSAGVWTENVLYSFAGGSDGCGPVRLKRDSSGNFYGVTHGGGTSGSGTVFELTAKGSSWHESVLYSFDSGGTEPDTPVDLDRDAATGTLYGVTYWGGSDGFGAVFELTQSGGSWTETVLHSFTQFPDGNLPVGLNRDKSGALFGTTYQGGSHGHGMVFELTQSAGSWTETILYNFAKARDAAFPAGRLVEDSSGNLYGMSTFGGYGKGPKQKGTVYMISP